ncbi:hypothetical protein N802_19025 [Knoellia sinensis KCTC 19936]|uniref:Uncharacterized protein n=1 Tax=Knoellia sinensis KCTC 19936 TaxID=1385520 RepID=A0A0A0J8K5_9MICO|nr:hypothetical protein [Knoellia sinensis]KGN31951.1 hypothetical protein N802_19025 [Knoellia sinensis KCTC 19936]
MNAGEGQSGVLRLSRLGRAWRAGLVVALTALFCAGSLVGNDHWWPFSPWRMFATSQAATGSVWSTGIEVRTADDPNTWVPARLTPENVGVNRAEVEGRIPQIQADPARLGTLAASHARLRPGSAAWLGLRVVRHKIIVVDREPTGEVETDVLAEWSAP